MAASRRSGARREYVGRPVRLRAAGIPTLQENPTCALTVPSWVMARSNFKVGDKFVPSIEDDKIIYTKEVMPDV
jgi:hypothetical protein